MFGLLLVACFGLLLGPDFIQSFPDLGSIFPNFVVDFRRFFADLVRSNPDLYSNHLATFKTFHFNHVLNFSSCLYFHHLHFSSPDFCPFSYGFLTCRSTDSTCSSYSIAMRIGSGCLSPSALS